MRSQPFTKEGLNGPTLLRPDAVRAEGDRLRNRLRSCLGKPDCSLDFEGGLRTASADTEPIGGMIHRPMFERLDSRGPRV